GLRGGLPLRQWHHAPGIRAAQRGRRAAYARDVGGPRREGGGGGPEESGGALRGVRLSRVQDREWHRDDRRLSGRLVSGFGRQHPVHPLITCRAQAVWPLAAMTSVDRTSRAIRALFARIRGGVGFRWSPNAEDRSDLLARGQVAALEG